jgi:hypothetical protein
MHGMGRYRVRKILLVHGPLATVHEDSASILVLKDLKGDVSVDLAVRG